MASYFYVKQGLGTRTTGGGRTQQSGAFGDTGLEAADVYATVALALADSPAAGDFIHVSDAHSYSETSTHLEYGQAAVDTPIIVMSVSDTDVTAYSPGAAEDVTGSNKIKMSTAGSKISIHGMDLQTADKLWAANDAQAVILNDLTITFTGSGDGFQINGGDGTSIELNDVAMVWTAGTTNSIVQFANNAAVLKWKNCTLSDGTGALDDILRGNGENGGFNFYAENCDLSSVVGYVWGDFGASSVTDDNGTCIIKNCRMNADPALFIQEDFYSHGQYFLATNCSSDSGKAEYQFFQKTMAGEVQDSGDDSTNIYRNETTAFTNTNKTSFKCTTLAQCGEGSPLVFDMPARYADLTVAGTNEVTVYFATPQANDLTTANTWVEVSYPDATNKQLWRTESSRAADILSSTALTDDSASSTWKSGGSDLASYDEHRITVDTTATNAGSECVIQVKVFCTVPNITFYVDTTVDLS